MTKRHRNSSSRNERINSGIQGAAAFFVISLSVLDLTGLLEINWFYSNLQTVTLLAIGIVLLTSLLERHVTLEGLRTELAALSGSVSSGTQYLGDSDAARAALDQMVAKPTEKLLSLGGKSSGEPYLERIGTKAVAGEIRYDKLLTGSHITHELHEHLARLITSPMATIAWTYSEKYGLMTISDEMVVVAFPTPHPNRFRGLKLEGAGHVNNFSDIFWDAFKSEQCINIKCPQSLVFLCEKCGSGCRDKAEIVAALKKIEGGTIERNGNSESDRKL